MVATNTDKLLLLFPLGGGRDPLQLHRGAAGQGLLWLRSAGLSDRNCRGGALGSNRRGKRLPGREGEGGGVTVEFLFPAGPGGRQAQHRARPCSRAARGREDHQIINTKYTLISYNLLPLSFYLLIIFSSINAKK